MIYAGQGDLNARPRCMQLVMSDVRAYMCHCCVYCLVFSEIQSMLFPKLETGTF